MDTAASTKRPTSTMLTAETETEYYFQFNPLACEQNAGAHGVEIEIGDAYPNQWYSRRDRKSQRSNSCNHRLRNLCQRSVPEIPEMLAGIFQYSALLPRGSMYFPVV